MRRQPPQPPPPPPPGYYYYDPSYHYLPQQLGYIGYNDLFVSPWPGAYPSYPPSNSAGQFPSEPPPHPSWLPQQPGAYPSNAAGQFPSEPPPHPPWLPQQPGAYPSNAAGQFSSEPPPHPSWLPQQPGAYPSNAAGQFPSEPPPHQPQPHPPPPGVSGPLYYQSGQQPPLPPYQPDPTPPPPPYQPDPTPPPPPYQSEDGCSYGDQMDAARDTDADIKIIMSQILFKVADQIIDEFTGKIIAEDGADCKGLAKILASLGSADTDAGLGSIQQPSDYNTLQLGVDTYSDTLGSSRNLLGDMTGKGDSHSKEKHHRSSFFSVPACFRNPSSPDESREDSRRRSKKGSKPSRKRDESSNRSYYSSHEYSEDSRSSRNPTSSKKESKRSRRSISPHHRRH
ncbi:uncharacterized protein LOC108856633 isoform X4 [Raphanus sativus]|uniref:Uncharacterized protein LOC108856633 isoform X4 n=1 Tax=Raphanus sativus TaxID=3726 RepID=A0A9W3CWL6_RAPSA|nr:uncharacterized protein LOC108856633 isoform X4 [Raphanus sativus]